MKQAFLPIKIALLLCAFSFSLFSAPPEHLFAREDESRIEEKKPETKKGVNQPKDEQGREEGGGAGSLSLIDEVVRVLFGTSTPEELNNNKATTASDQGTTSVATTTKEEKKEIEQTPATTSTSTSVVTILPASSTNATSGTSTLIATGTPLPITPTSTSSALGRTIGLAPGSGLWLPKTIINPYQFETLGALWTGRLYVIALLLALFGVGLVTGILDPYFAQGNARTVRAFLARSNR